MIECIISNLMSNVEHKKKYRTRDNSWKTFGAQEGGGLALFTTYAGYLHLFILNSEINFLV